MSNQKNNTNKKTMEELIKKLIHNEVMNSAELALFTNFSFAEIAEIAIQIEGSDILSTLPPISILSQLTLPYGGISKNLSNPDQLSNFQKNILKIPRMNLIKKLIHNEVMDEEELTLLASFSFAEIAEIAIQIERSDILSTLPSVAILSQLSIPYGGVIENLSSPEQMTHFQKNLLKIQQIQIKYQQNNKNTYTVIKKGNSR